MKYAPMIRIAAVLCFIAFILVGIKAFSSRGEGIFPYMMAVSSFCFLIGSICFFFASRKK